MQLMAGARAHDAAHSILGEGPGLVAVAVDPGARAGQPLQALALANAERAVVIDARNSPELKNVWAAERPFAAYDAKAVQRALLQTWETGPARWGCLKLSALLLAGGRDADTTLNGIAATYGASLPDPTQGLQALADHARALVPLVTRQAQSIKADGLQDVSRLEAAAVAPIAAMEHHGMPFDAASWRDLTGQDTKRREGVRSQLLEALIPKDARDLFGSAQLNLESDTEVLEILRRHGHNVPNMRRRTLALLPPPLGPWLTEYRVLAKLVSAYGLGFLEHVGKDGRLHPTFEQIGASTGRMACYEPNLQAMTRDSGRRSCFRVAAGRALVVADYAACELRILAEMSTDPVFLEAFAAGEDLHARVASSIFNKTVNKTENASLRQVAKAVNFGLAYGMGAQGLARTLRMSEMEAQDLLRRYFTTFPRIRGFLQDSADAALARGYAATLSGRRLYLDTPSDGRERAAAVRVGKNMPIQGTNADITKMALARLWRALSTFSEAFPVNCVHDEIVVECRADDANAVRDAAVKAMQDAGAQVLRQVPLAVDAHITEVWDK